MLFRIEIHTEKYLEMWLDEIIKKYLRAFEKRSNLSD